MAKKKADTANPLAAKMHRPKPVAAPKPEVESKSVQSRKALQRPKAKKAAAAEHVVTPMTDRSGTPFDPAVHAVHADGVTPHADSAGKFIRKSDHYDGAKKAHYGDTYRHA